MRLPFFKPNPMPEPAAGVSGGSVRGAGATRRVGRARAVAAAAVEAAELPAAVDAARTRARRRLVGAVALLAAGVIGFPLLFETQPRPIAIDVPIDASRTAGGRTAGGAVERARPDAGREAATPAAEAPAPARAAGETERVAAVAPGTAGAASAAPAGRETFERSTEARGAAPRERGDASPVAAPAVAASRDAAAGARAGGGDPPSASRSAGATTAAASAPRGAASAAARAARPAAGETETARAATPADAAPSAAGGERWVVQVGAFNDAVRMRETRTRVERAGFRTYISDVNSPTGPRTRVRLGPFGSRKEADSAAAKMKTIGLPANVLQL